MEGGITSARRRASTREQLGATPTVKQGVTHNRQQRWCHPLIPLIRSQLHRPPELEGYPAAANDEHGGGPQGPFSEGTFAGLGVDSPARLPGLLAFRRR